MGDHKPIRLEWVPEVYKEIEKVTGIKIEVVSRESAHLNPSQGFRKKNNRSLVKKRCRKG